MPDRPSPPVTLRALLAGDAAFLCRLMNEPAWLRFIGDRGVRDEALARRYIAEGPWAAHRTEGLGLRLVALEATGEPVGLCGLLRREYLTDPDLGFAFLEAFAGRGLAYEACRLTLERARVELALKRVLAITAKDNERAIRLLGRLSFAFEGTLTPEPDAAPVALYARAP